MACKTVIINIPNSLQFIKLTCHCQIHKLWMNINFSNQFEYRQQNMWYYTGLFHRLCECSNSRPDQDNYSLETSVFCLYHFEGQSYGLPLSGWFRTMILRCASRTLPFVVTGLDIKQIMHPCEQLLLSSEQWETQTLKSFANKLTHNTEASITWCQELGWPLFWTSSAQILLCNMTRKPVVTEEDYSIDLHHCNLRTGLILYVSF